jgi:hypothetical protein
VFELEPGGALSFEAVDEHFSLSFVFKGDFRVSLFLEQGDRGRSREIEGDRRRETRIACVSLFLEQKVTNPAAPKVAKGPLGLRGSAAPAPPERVGTGIQKDRTGKFHGLRGGMCYQVAVEEDEAAEAAARASGGAASSPAARLSAAALASTACMASKLTTAKKLSSAGLPGRSEDGSTRTSALLAAELQSLSTTDVEERSERYRALREASDLQDVVFGGGGGMGGGCRRGEGA